MSAFLKMVESIEGELVTVTVPVMFWNDHEGRELVDDGDVVAVWWENYRQVKLTMTLAAARELLSDSDHYATQAAEFEWPSLTNSAAATVRALAKVGITRASCGWSGR